MIIFFIFYRKLCHLQELHTKRKISLQKFHEHPFFINCKNLCRYRHTLSILSIIRGEKLLECNILVTSRPHGTRAVEQYFRKAVRLDRFTESNAKQIASRILSDESKIDYVLRFSPADFREDIPIYKCPILLSFLCLLVREDDIDLSHRTKHTGEIYTRMVSCLYKKFTIRRGLDFER